jgi:hypothetical protein
MLQQRLKSSAKAPSTHDTFDSGCPKLLPHNLTPLSGTERKRIFSRTATRAQFEPRPLEPFKSGSRFGSRPRNAETFLLLGDLIVATMMD